MKNMLSYMQQYMWKPYTNEELYIYWGYIYLRCILYMQNMHASMKHYMTKQTPYVCIIICYISGQLQLCGIVGQLNRWIQPTQSEDWYIIFSANWTQTIALFYLIHTYLISSVGGKLPSLDRGSAQFSRKARSQLRSKWPI